MSGACRRATRCDRIASDYREFWYPKRCRRETSEAEDERERLIDGTKLGAVQAADGASESLRVDDGRLKAST
jgi:hypothetical protein